MALAQADIFRDSLIGGGACGRLIADREWALTSLGPLQSWPQSLRTATLLLLRSPVPIVMLWGTDGIMLYNDAYSVFAGGRHPRLLGSKVREGWPEVAEFNDNVMRVGLAGGTLQYKDQELTLYRHGRPERVWMNLDYSPVVDENGVPAGVFAVVVETTERVAAERQLRDSNERFRAFLTASANSMYRMSPDWGELRELDGQGFLTDTAGPNRAWIEDYIDPRDKGAVLSAIERAIATRSILDLEHRIRLADGRFGWTHSRAVPILDDAGAVVEWFGAAQDVTVRKEAEERLRSSEARLAAIFDDATVGLSEVALDGRFLHVNGELCRLLGRSREALLRSAMAEVTDPDDRASILTAIDDAIDRGHASSLDIRYVRPDGQRVWSNSRITRLHEADGRLGNLLVVTVDLTERRAADAALRESEARFRLMADAVPQIVWITDSQGRMEFLNRQFTRYTGADYDAFTPSEMAASFISPEDGPAVVAAFEKALQSGSPFNIEHRILSAKGEWRWFVARAEPHCDPVTGAIVRWFGASVDIHDRKLAEARLKELNETLEQRVNSALAERKVFSDVVESSPAAVTALDLDFRILAINRANMEAFDRIFGRCPKVGEILLDALHDLPEHREQMRHYWARALAGEEYVVTEEFGESSLGRRHYEVRFSTIRDAQGKRIGAASTSYDVTDRVTAEQMLAAAQEQLRQSQKMEAMGQLTGGVAHDFNNLLTPIMGSLDILQRRGLGGEREQRLIAGAMQSAERARILVQRLLAFARRQPLQPIPVDIDLLVTGMGDLVASTTGPQIRVIVESSPTLPPAKADPNQLEMALLNLAVNARDAMPDGGTLRIAASLSQVRAGHRSKLRPGSYIRISVADSGIGMDAETMTRAVEPFFSTKGIGKGTGLGLSMVHGLALQLGGALTIQSRPGFGTNVELWLPQSASAVMLSEARSDPGAPLGGSGTVLLVDDEELVRMTAADMLIDLGYSVIEAASGEMAMRLIDEGRHFDLLVTDHLMPGMTGAELARAVRAMRPEASVLLVSGYADQEGITPDLPRLTKPFRKDELAAMLARF